MKNILPVIFLLFSVHCFSQINCPAFGRLQNYEKWEIMATWNTVDPYSSLANIHLDDNSFLNGGEFTNKSIAAGLIVKYYFDNITTVRLKFIYTKRNIHDQRSLIDTLGTENIYDEQFDETLYKIAPGFQWTWFVERFSFFGGFEVPYTYHSDFIQTENILDTSTVSQTGNKVQNTVTVPGGFSVGLGAYVGSVFYFKRIFGIGFEISSAYEYSKLGGTVSAESMASNTPDVVNKFEYIDQKEVWSFTPVQASLQLSIRF